MNDTRSKLPPFDLDTYKIRLFEDSRFQTTDPDGGVRKPASGVLKSAGNLKLISENSDRTGDKKKSKKTGEKAKVEIDSVATKRGKRTKTRKNIDRGGSDTTVEQLSDIYYEKNALDGCETDASEGNYDDGDSRTHKPRGDMFYWDNDAHSESSSDYEPLVESDLQKELADTAWGNETIPQSEDVSLRLAILGCDWETITAQDLYVLCHTVSLGKPCDLGTAFTEEGDKISKNILEAWVYPSKFGKQRMAEVEKRGPVLPSITAEEEEWNPAVSEINHLAVRSFERERSRYFYGVIACASVQIAQCLYDELDSIAAGFALDALDLRFIPDEIQEFEFQPASYANSIPKSYCAPKSVCISGLLSSNARLKWDLDDPKEKLVQRIMSEGDLLEMNINEILDSDLSEMEMKPNEARKLLLGDSSDDENYDAYTSKAENFFDTVRDENSFGEEEPDITRNTIGASLKSFEKSRREQREETKKPVKKRKSRSVRYIF